MGTDFLKRVGPSFHRALDRREVELRTPTLFSTDIPCVSRMASAQIADGVKLQAGEKVLVRYVDQKLVVQRGQALVGEFPAPPAEYLNRVVGGACIEQAEVKVVHSISGTAEIAFCD